MNIKTVNEYVFFEHKIKIDKKMAMQIKVNRSSSTGNFREIKHDVFINKVIQMYLK